MQAKILAWLLLLCGALPACADEVESLSQPAGTGGVPTEAVRIKSENPDYPSSAESRGQEGWVMLSFTVDTEGKVAEAMVEDSSGIEVLEKAALEAAKQWQYEPARLNGSPVEESMTRVQMRFALKSSKGESPGITAASPAFARQYRKIEKLITEKDLTAAQPLMMDLWDRGVQNLYENAWFWLLKYRFLAAGGTADSHDKRDCLKKAVGYENDYLAPDEFVAAVQELYRLAVADHDYSEALEAFERLDDSTAAKKSSRYVKTHEVLEQNVAMLREIIASDRILPVEGKIVQYGYWHHALLRRAFSISEVTGRIEVVDIRCERGTRRYSMSTTSTWTIPESWGECRVYLKGDDGTTFTLHELPVTAAR